MSTTPKNAAGWGPPQLVLPSPVAEVPPVPTQDGQDALQVLLAFACIHDQAVQRRRNGSAADAPFDEYFGLDEVLRLVAARAAAITGADGVAIALAKENAIVCRASIGKIAPDPGVRLDPDSGFSGACLRNGQTVCCDDSETDSRVNAQACRALGTRSMVAVPLTAKGRVIGLIEAFSSESFGFNESDVKSLNLLAELILAAIHPAEEDRLAQLADQILPKPPEPDPQEVRRADSRYPEPEAQAEKIAVSESSSPATSDQTETPSTSRAPIVGPPPGVDVPFTQSVIAAALEKVKEAELHSANAGIGNAERQPKSVLEIGPVAVVPAKVEAVPFSAPAISFPEEKRSRSGIFLVAGLVLVAIALGWTWLHHAEQLTSANTRQATPFKPSVDSKESDLPLSPPPKPGVTPQVTGIRHWSSPESSTVVVDVEDQVQYEAHTLDNPPRIYFDLHDTNMAPGLLNQSIDVNDVFLKRLRMAQPTEGITRVVLETKGLTEVSVKLDPSPYRLTIDVHKPLAGLTPAPLTKPSPSIATAPKAPPKALIKKKSSQSASTSGSEFRVVLDAGHGGWDLGTVGRKGLLEKDLVLDIVQRLGRLVQEKLGADVIYTRQDDSYLPLEKRAEIANITKADLFVSVHANYSDLATARGVETYYTTSYSSVKARTVEDDPVLKDVNWTGVDIREKVTNSHRLASDMQEALYGGLAARTPALRNRGVKEAQYVVLTGTQMPAVLAEVSFVSSPVDETNLQNSGYRQQIAEALYRGVARYRAETRHTKLASRSKPLTNSE